MCPSIDRPECLTDSQVVHIDEPVLHRTRHQCGFCGRRPTRLRIFLPNPREMGVQCTCRNEEVCAGIGLGIALYPLHQHFPLPARQRRTGDTGYTRGVGAQPGPAATAMLDGPLGFRDPALVVNYRKQYENPSLWFAPHPVSSSGMRHREIQTQFPIAFCANARTVDIRPVTMDSGAASRRDRVTGGGTGPGRSRRRSRSRAGHRPDRRGPCTAPRSSRPGPGRSP